MYMPGECFLMTVCVAYCALLCVCLYNCMVVHFIFCPLAAFCHANFTIKMNWIELNRMCLKRWRSKISYAAAFEPTEDAVSSWQVAQPAQRCSSQAGWGPTRRPVTGRQRSVPVAGYCAAVVTCWSSTRHSLLDMVLYRQVRVDEDTQVARRRRMLNGRRTNDRTCCR